MCMGVYIYMHTCMGAHTHMCIHVCAYAHTCIHIQLIVSHKKLEFVCNLSGVQWLDCVIPLCLTKEVFIVYQQLTKDEKLNVA